MSSAQTDSATEVLAPDVAAACDGCEIDSVSQQTVEEGPPPSAARPSSPRDILMVLIAYGSRGVIR